MSFAELGFAALAIVTLVGAMGAVTLKNLTHALLSLVVFFFGVAGLFFSLRADFVGAVQILVYVGAVAVLMVFAIVLTRSTDAPEPQIGGFRWVGVLAASLVGGVLVGVLLVEPQRGEPATVPSASAEQLGVAMMTTYAVPFELASILLTAALIGAVVIALDEIRRRVGDAGEKGREG
jgi:NADH:ubiquinone oxidoreductase subunit 6 (subunit J)